jgi:hypothetical protein
MNVMLYGKEFHIILSCNHLSGSTLYLALNFVLKIPAAMRGVSPSSYKEMVEFSTYSLWLYIF